MGADMTIATFPVLRLNNERQTRIMASLDQRKLGKSSNSGCQLFGMKDLANAVLELICERGFRKRPKGFMGYIDILNPLCTKKTIALLNSFAEEDRQQPKSTRLPVQRGSKMSTWRGGCR